MKIKKIYFLGIKGVGMTALAIYCKQKGFTVWGGDSKEIFHTDSLLEKEGIPVGLASKDDLRNADMIIYSGAYDIGKNDFFLTALKRGIKIMSHGQALGYFMKGYKQISVAGTHGKTTTTGLIATIAIESGLDPSYIIGAASIDPLGAPGHYGCGEYFISEADEYQTAINNDTKPRFLWQNPYILVITNIDFDHPDVYKNITQVKHAFKQLAIKVPKNGLIVYNLEDKNSCEVVSSAKCNKIGFDGFDNNLKLQIIGKHNIQNANAAIIAARFMGINLQTIKNAINKYKGAKRRLEIIKEKNGVLYMDDYAHHPTEIKASLAALKDKYKKRRVIVLFQPHTFSRTQALFSQFTKAFGQADLLILAPIFASAREEKSKFSISDEDLFKAIRTNKEQVYLAQSQDEMVQYMKRFIERGDIVITMGAGDIYKIHDRL